MDVQQMMKMAELAQKAQDECNNGAGGSDLPPIAPPNNPDEAKKAAHAMALRMGCDPKAADDMLAKFESMSHTDLMNTFSQEIGATPEQTDRLNNLDPSNLFADMQNFMANQSISPTDPTQQQPPVPAVVPQPDAFKKVAIIREAGNKFFKAGDTKNASVKYEEGLRAIRDCPNYEQSEHLTAMELNLALCRLKSKPSEPRDCIALCSGVLNREHDNVKALFRRAKAHIKLNRLPAAEEDLARAAELAPDDDNIREELCALHEQMDDEEVLVCSSDGSSVCSSASPSPDRSQMTKPATAPTVSPVSSASTEAPQPAAQLFRPVSATSTESVAERPPARPLGDTTAATSFFPTIVSPKLVSTDDQKKQARAQATTRLPPRPRTTRASRREHVPEGATPALDEIRDGFWEWVEGVKSVIAAPSGLAFSSAKQSRHDHMRARNADLGKRAQCCMFMGVPALERPMAPKQPEPSPQRGSRRRRSSRNSSSRKASGILEMPLGGKSFGV